MSVDDKTYSCFAIAFHCLRKSTAAIHHRQRDTINEEWREDGLYIKYCYLQTEMTVMSSHNERSHPDLDSAYLLIRGFVYLMNI